MTKLTPKLRASVDTKLTPKTDARGQFYRGPKTDLFSQFLGQFYLGSVLPEVSFAVLTEMPVTEAVTASVLRRRGDVKM